MERGRKIMTRKEIVLAGGCFWGVEKYLSLIPGVLSTEVGYANGRTENPSYEQVCREDTGHAEAVKVIYDGDALPLKELLTRFFRVVDPSSLDRQGPDVGKQYRSGVYYTDASDASIIQGVLEGLAQQYDAPIVVQSAPLENYYIAEEYHQKYLDKNPGGYCHIPAGAFDLAKE